MGAGGSSAGGAGGDIQDGSVVDAGGAPDAGNVTGDYLEAEDGVLSGPFVIGADARASNGHFITPEVGSSSETEPGPARAEYRFVAPTSGTYQIWGRIHSPDVSENRFWFQLDGGTWIKWRITTGDIWFWDAFHDNLDYGTPLQFTLGTGPHTLVIANCVDGVGLDRLYYAADTITPPGNDTPCDPPNSIDTDAGCQRSCGSLGGTHCSTTECVGLPTVHTFDCAACCPATL